MKINMPINQTEYRVDPKQPIVTRTDLKGIITYANPAFRQANPHAEVELNALAAADQNDPTLPRSPYVGIQWVGIPEFQAIGTAVGQQISTLLQPQPPKVEKVLAQAQQAVERKMREAGYLKDGAKDGAKD